MVTVRIVGGLGNQLFQYAFGRALSFKKNTGLLLDYYDQMIRKDFDGENLTRITDVFDLPVKLYIGKARKDLVNRWGLFYLCRFLDKVYLKTKCVITDDNYGSSQDKLERNEYIYLSGYWQSEKYFTEVREIIRKDLKFKMEGLISGLDIFKKIAGNNSIGIHIRGKDYLVNSVYSRCDVKYYLDAIAIIRKSTADPRIFIFTDDIDNVNRDYKELLRFSEIVSVQTPFKSDAVDMLLMSKCKHQVIGNSSFSWWGAWLNDNPDKIVISPRLWFNTPVYSSEHIVPEGWIRI